MNILQELSDHEPDKRIEFCKLVINLIDAEAGTLKNISFSDEYTFFLKEQDNK